MHITGHIISFIFQFAEVSEMSSRLTSESRIYADKARDLNRQVSFIGLMRIIYMRIIQLNSLVCGILMTILLLKLPSVWCADMLVKLRLCEL